MICLYKIEKLFLGNNYIQLKGKQGIGMNIWKLLSR